MKAFCAAGVMLLMSVAGLTASPDPVPPGWGIDACLTAHVAPADRAAYLELLARSGVRVLRERGVQVPADGATPAEPLAGLRQLAAAGFQTVGFATLPLEVVVKQRGNTLPEDLLAVYAGGRELGRQYAGIVPAFELVGEPDLGYCTDLPDRVAAFQKAWYLGLKAGGKQAGAKSPMVLMGALGSPPGPWLERAARNGLLDYTDAYNFHFYGHAEDLTAEIKAHRKFAAQWGRRGIPLWITECGINAVAPDDLLNTRRRQLQADFTVTTARQAFKARDVAVFMPFILVGKGVDPYALTLGADRPLPAWTAYAKFTREHPWPQRLQTMPPRDPNPIVVQWLPDNRTTIPHKVSGTYRFRPGQPIQGELRLYNFSDQPVRGRLKGSDLRHVTVDSTVLAADITVPPMGMTAIPVSFAARKTGYFREFWSGEFTANTGRRSPVYFGLERGPEAGDLVERPVLFREIPAGRVQHPFHPDYRVTAQSGPWTGLNGLQVESKGQGGEVVAWTERKEDDPLFPPMAVTQVRGLPQQGFFRLQLDRPMSRSEKVRVDLVDDLGRRFTIWENFGVNYFVKSPDVWLNLEDFHNYSWGRTQENPAFHPERVREVQLRFYLATAKAPMRVRLALLQARVSN